MRRVTGHSPYITGKRKALDVAYSKPVDVTTFEQLVKEVAKTAYLNKDYLLFYRGQTRDHRNKTGASSFYPSIYRGDPLPAAQLELSFDLLSKASRQLCEALKLKGIQGHLEVSRRRYIQWSILQHYGVCRTPLLDLTHSLTAACSFALTGEEGEEAYVYAFGLPYVTNRISAHSEHEIVNIRLLSISPPEALRPYFQQGYLACTEDLTTEFSNKNELDFNRRLFAKYRLVNSRNFWGKDFAKIPRRLLFPSNDRMAVVCSQLIKDLKTSDGVSLEYVGRFIQTWGSLESFVLSQARDIENGRNYMSFNSALNSLKNNHVVDNSTFVEIIKLKKARNQIVHNPGSIVQMELSELEKNIESWIRHISLNQKSKSSNAIS